VKIVLPDLKVLLTGKSNCCTTCLGLLMKLCYADENLKVSKGESDRPPNLSIKDCYNAPAAKDTTEHNKIQR
jgi:hypothetical protein